MADKYWEDFKVGEVQTTSAVTVTETHLVNFASFTGDWYPLHMDEEFAKKTIFGGRIAHGPLIFALANGLMDRSGFLGDAGMAFLGADKLRFQAPVRLGDTIHLEIEVREKRETRKSDRGVTTLELRVNNQKNETVMTVDMTLLMRRRA